MTASTRRDAATLSKLRHLYENMVNGAVPDTASAKRIAEGLLSPAIAELEHGAALTQAADAGAAEPVATIEALQARIAELEAEVDDMEAERDEALRGPWPEWAEQMKKTIRKYSGNDGFDDASEGVDLPAELDELMEHAVEPSAQQLQQAVARTIEKCAVICEAIEDDYQEREGHKYPELKSDAQTGARDCAAAIRQQGTP